MFVSLIQVSCQCNTERVVPRQTYRVDGLFWPLHRYLPLVHVGFVRHRDLHTVQWAGLDLAIFLGLCQWTDVCLKQ